MTKKNNLMERLADEFESAGYEVHKGWFDDRSASWLDIRKKDKKEFFLEISFNYKGTKLTNFDVFKDIYDVVDTQKIF